MIGLTIQVPLKGQEKKKKKKKNPNSPTDQMILILEGMLATGGQVSATDFAKRYY